MHDGNGAKFWLLAIAGVGFVAILAVALNSAADDLEGVDWLVEGMVLEGSSTAPLPGTALTARFDSGSLNGLAGCNNFFASYELHDDSITVGPAGSTMMFCSAPDGIMDQELNYLTLLSSADGFEVDGDSLSLTSADSEVLQFVKVDVD